MPYTAQSRRKPYDAEIEAVPITSETTIGDLNYIITRLCLRYILANDLQYTTLNAVQGVLSEVAGEIRRRLTVKYENQKMLEHGDVFEYSILDSRLKREAKQ